MLHPSLLKLLLAVLAILVSASRSWSQPLVPIGGWHEGPAISCAIGDDTVVITGSHRVFVYDMAEFSPAGLLSGFVLPFEAQDVKWLGSDTVMILGNRSDVLLLDLQDPRNPQLLSHTDLGHPATAFAVRDSLVYISCDDGTRFMLVYSFSSAGQPQLLATIPGLGATQLETSGNTLVSLDRDWIRLYSLAAPLSPTLVSTLDFGVIDGSNIVVDGNILYCSYVIWDADNGVIAVDITDPANPETLGIFRGWFEHIHGAHQGYVYLNIEPDSLSIVDFNDSIAPHIVGAIPSHGYFEASDQRDDRLVVIASGDAELFSLQQPATPLSEGFLDFPSAMIAVSADGPWAWAAQGNDIRTLNVADPTRIDSTGHVSLGTGWRSEARNLRRQGDVLLAGQNFGLTAFRIETSAQLSPLAVFPQGRMASLLGDVLLMAAGADGLLVYDVSDWSTPLPIAGIDSMRVYDVRLLGELAILRTSQPSRIVMVDVAIPSAPVVLGQWSVPDGLFSMALGDSVVYIGASLNQISDQRVEVISIHDPANPQLLETIPLPEVAFTLAVNNGRLYMGRPDRGWFSVSPIDENGVPHSTETQELHGVNGSIGVSGGTVYVPLGTAGLQVYRDSGIPLPGYSPPLTIQLMNRHRILLSWIPDVGSSDFRIESADSPSGPWILQTTTRETSVILPREPGATKTFFRVIQEYD